MSFLGGCIGLLWFVLVLRTCWAPMRGFEQRWTDLLLVTLFLTGGYIVLYFSAMLAAHLA